ncbi:DUF4760 domain-containing protein [Kingella potus]|uniref:DUF4760 domain-containing protein n=1 Tax=Kingella potus TaxID=265175 RepID=UPI001FD421AF|nr:hypothetical protein [Kingella potus]UOP01102.1 hypothetical protein LVJ84_01760 [Kingella potus]
MADDPAAQQTLQSWLKGREHIRAVVESRNTAAEAVLNGLLEENAYRLVRRRAVLADFRMLADYTAARRAGDAGYAEAFVRLAQRWEKE